MSYNEPVPWAELLAQVCNERDKARDRVRRLEDLAVVAWGVIANAGGGNWETETDDWQVGAARWRDNWLATVNQPSTEPTVYCTVNSCIIVNYLRR